MDKKIIFFDGVCNLCNRFIQFVIKYDKRKLFYFAPLQGRNSKIFLNEKDLKIDKIQTIFLFDSGKIYNRSTAVLKIIKLFSNYWSLFYIFIIIPKFIRDLVYNIVAKYRYKLFGKMDQCMIPHPSLMDRFLD